MNKPKNCIARLGNPPRRRPRTATRWPLCSIGDCQQNLEAEDSSAKPGTAGAGPHAPRHLNSLTFLALVAAQQNHLEQAEKLYREALDGWRSTVGDEHPATRATVCNLASVYTNWCWQLATAADVSQRDPPRR